MRIDCANTITITVPNDGADRTHLECGAPRSQARALAVRTSARVRSLAPLVRPALARLAALALTAALSAQGAAAAGSASGVPRSSRPARSQMLEARSDRGCLPDGSGYLRARIRGAEHLDVDWHNAELECQGSVRPRNRGLRVSFAGPLPRRGQRLRMIFGIGAIAAGRAGRELPTNVTVIFEGARRLYSTLSQDKCTVDRLRQTRVARRDGVDIYRVVARGFCFDPLTDLLHDDRIVMSRFDFAGRIALASPSS
jgi:hypothetical protein